MMENINTNNKEIQDLERRDWRLWAITLTLLFSLATFIVLVYLFYFYWNTPEEGGKILNKYEMTIFLSGFAVLVLLFCGYMVLKEREIRKLRFILIEDQIHLEALNRRFIELESLFKISTVVNSQMDVSGILNTITRTVVECLDADQSSLLLTDETKEKLSCEAAYGAGFEWNYGKEVKLGEGIAGYVAANGCPLLLDDKIDRSRFKNFVEKDINITSALYVPLKTEAEIIGVLNVNRIEREEEFTENDLKLLSIFADNAAIAIEKAILYQDLQAHIMSLKQANEELKEAQARLVKSEKLVAIGEMTAHIAHRTLNPLTTIISCVQLSMNGDDKADRYMTYLKRIGSEAEKIEKIIRGVLVYSRPGRMHKKPTDFNKLLEEVLAQLEYIISKNRVNTHKHFSSDLPKIMAERSRLEEAFVNVIMNALDAMPTGGNLTISTSIRRLESEVFIKEKTKNDYGLQTKNHERKRGLIEVSVTDNGIGISEENLDNVFQPFFTTKNPKEGTGLGLAITYGIIMSHNGKIDIASKHGKGTTVTICLPI